MGSNKELTNLDKPMPDTVTIDAETRLGLLAEILHEIALGEVMHAASD